MLPLLSHLELQKLQPQYVCDKLKKYQICSIRHFERVHIHTTLIIVYCYNCSILLLAIVNLLLCLIYKLNFISPSRH